jgi:hypothetical protein
VLSYWQIWPSTLCGVHSFRPMPLYSHARLRVPALFDLSKRMLFSAASDGRFGLKVLTSMEDVCLNSGASESSFWSRAFDKAIMQRGSRDEMQHKQRREKLPHSTGWNGPIFEKRAAWETWRGNLEGFPIFIYLDISLSFSTSRHSFVVSYVPPPLLKSQGEISFKGEGCNTPCYNFPNYFH